MGAQAQQEEVVSRVGSKHPGDCVPRDVPVQPDSGGSWRRRGLMARRAGQLAGSPCRGLQGSSRGPEGLMLACYLQGRGVPYRGFGSPARQTVLGQSSRSRALAGQICGMCNCILHLRFY